MLIIATAAAPCFWPNTARATRAQLPRAVTTSLPVISAGSYSISLQPSETEPSAFLRTCTGQLVPSVNVAPFAFRAAIVLPVLSAMFAAGNVGVESFAATLMPLVVVEGAPTMYRGVPALPAAATTTMPAADALSDASAVAESARP